MARLILFFYELLSYLLVLPLSLYLSKHQNFRGTIADRLGLRLPEIPANRKAVWIHAASVGEVNAVSYLLARIKKEKPNLFICLSVNTKAGREVAGKIKDIDLLFPFPFDLSWVMNRYLKRLSPIALIIVETEVWPQLIMSAKKNGVHVVFVNARMSDKAFQGYKKISSLMKMIFTGTHILSMSEEDAARFSNLGADDVQVFGNLKFDSISLPDLDNRGRLKEKLGIKDRPVFIAGSVREGEERFVMEAIHYASEKILGLFSIIAPRHKESFAKITDMAGSLGMNWGLKSKDKFDVDLLIVDTFGELFDLYGASDVAFVGGSLIDLGGQNILEPLAWAIPTIHGKYMDNFLWAMDKVSGLTIEAENPDSLGELVCKVFQDIETYKAMAAKARNILDQTKGSTDQYMHTLEQYLK